MYLIDTLFCLLLLGDNNAFEREWIRSTYLDLEVTSRHVTFSLLSRTSADTDDRPHQNMPLSTQ